MERISRKMSFTPKSMPSVHVAAAAPEIDTVKTTASTLSKWIPLLCAGAAAGVSIIALKEIKNVRKELITLKREQNKEHPVNDELNKRMLAMEDQLKLLTDFIKNKEKVTKETEIIRNVVQTPQQPVKIINDEEYEEVEVTDDEAEDSSSSPPPPK